MNESITHIPFLAGIAFFQSDRSIEEMGNILSEHLLGGLPFGGLDLGIRDEIPAMCIEGNIMGLEIVLSGHPGKQTNRYYTFEVVSRFNKGRNVKRSATIDMNDYLKVLFQEKLKDISDLIMLDKSTIVSWLQEKQ
jgi:hypothetical protein